MKRELRFITACPLDTYFTWQVHLWLESLRNIGYSDKAIVLIFQPNSRVNPKWDQIINLYPEAEFHFYTDDGRVTPLLGTYIPILRPYLMSKYCEQFPDISDKAVFYCDSDILFTEKFNIDHLLDDDLIYGSDTNSYISASYFDSKIRDVLPDKLDQYKTIDVLNEAAKIVGITREVCEKNNLHSIGTQYLLKNTNKDFWENVFNKCIPLLMFLGEINKLFLENENKGLQRWTSDMWLVLWELWRLGYETKVVPELNFAWAPDPLEKLETHTIFHNAGITGNYLYSYPCFYKGAYVGGQNPLLDPHLDVVLNHPESKKHCTWYYADKLKSLGEKYKLKY
jgi:hypothetical protein